MKFKRLFKIVLKQPVYFKIYFEMINNKHNKI